MIPNGRGVFHDKFAASKKIKLGYVKEGKWVQGSQRVVIDRETNHFEVHWLVRARNGTEMKFGKIF